MKNFKKTIKRQEMIFKNPICCFNINYLFIRTKSFDMYNIFTMLAVAADSRANATDSDVQKREESREIHGMRISVRIVF